MVLLISPKSANTTRRLVEEAKKLNIGLQSTDVKDLAAENFAVDINRFDVLYVRQAHPYFKEILALAARFAKAGKRVVDKVLAENADLDFGKMEDLKILEQHKLPIPKTVWLKDLKQLSFPFQLKWNYGFGGKNVFYIKNQSALDKIINHRPIDKWLWQEYVPADFEYKVMTVGYQSLEKVLKFPISPISLRPDFGQAEVVNLNQAQEVIKLAEKASKILKKELAKVDIVQAGGKDYILEVNRWPGLEIYQQLSGVNIARAYLEYLQKSDR